MSISETAIILFVRNPVLGMVKTRLAKTIGNEKALEVYKLLLLHTQDITKAVDCPKYVYYAGEIPSQDLWNGEGYFKRKQTGYDLGERMHNSFNDLFKQGYTKVLIIGSDCYQLTTPILNEGITQLQSHDAVIGPAHDGGYYLLGMNSLIPELFRNKTWSSDKVRSETIADLDGMNMSYSLLPILNDIDEEGDLAKSNIDVLMI